jgi:hypothetical protein
MCALDFTSACQAKSFFGSRVCFYLWHLILLNLFNGLTYFLTSLDDIVSIIRLPSIWGSCSVLPCPSKAWANLSKSSSPLSLKAIVLPRKCTTTFTLAPSLRNLVACFSLKLKSCSSVLGPKRISFTTVFCALVLIAFCFLFCSYLNLE